MPLWYQVLPVQRSAFPRHLHWLYASGLSGKAGRKRHMGIRPTVRGSVMNPNDHPHGGGEGRAPVGRPGPCTPWGKPALGLKTRKKNKQSNKLIVRRRDGKAIK